MSSNRRDFIKFVVAGAVSAGCPIDLTLMAEASAARFASTVDSEDNVICHQVRDGMQFSRPVATARHDLIIVGGGISGLTAAYLSQQRDWLLLEKEPHFGGNAYLMEHLALRGAQVFLTTTDASLVERAAGPETLWLEVRSGTLHPARRS